MVIKNLLDRSKSIFENDFLSMKDRISKEVRQSTFVIVGGAGTIGSSVVKLLVSLKSKNIHVVDISENNLVELIRDIRSSNNEIVTEIKTYAMDCGSQEFLKFLTDQPSIDYLLNFSALKHVRSERNVYTLKRLIDVNIINSVKLLDLAVSKGCKKYFCVSTDKATNPTSMMGASKLLMEKIILSQKSTLKVSTARFANVAFSDGSLLFGFEHRLKKKQPLAIPVDIKRFFVTQEEAGQLCVLSCVLADDKEIFFPQTSKTFGDISLIDITSKFLQERGFEPAPFDDENMARNSVDKCVAQGKWPCFYFKSDTTGEKPFEEFYAKNEKVSFDDFDTIGKIKFDVGASNVDYNSFIQSYDNFKKGKNWKKSDLVGIFKRFLPNFLHEERHKNLDQKM